MLTQRVRPGRSWADQERLKGMLVPVGAAPEFGPEGKT